MLTKVRVTSNHGKEKNMNKKIVKKTIITLMVTLLYSCTNINEAEENDHRFGYSSFPIHGGVNIIADDPQNCTPERMNKLNNAYYFLRNYVGSVEYRNCLYDAFMVQTQRRSNPLNNADADVIWEISNNFRITEVHCGICDGATACSGRLTNNTEILTYSYTSIDRTPAELIAGQMMHELMHDYGFFHSRGNSADPSKRNIEYLQAPTGVAGQCFYNVASKQRNLMNGLLIGRSELEGQIELAFTGGDDVSEPFDRRCSDGRAIVGIGVFVDNTTNLITGIRPVCAFIDLQNDRWEFGSIETLVIEGDISNSTYDLRLCDDNEVAINVNGRSGALIDRIELQCASIAEVEHPDPVKGVTPTRTLGPFGGLGGHDFSRWCPTGKVLTGFRGRVDPALPIGQLKPLCSPINNLRERKMVVQDIMAGNPYGNSYDMRCSGTSAIVGLHGREGEFSIFWPINVVHRIGIECKNITWDSVNNNQNIHIDDGAGFGVSFVSPNTIPFGDQLPSTSSDHDQCPPDFVLAGLRVRSGYLVDQIQGICVRLSAWRAWDGNPAHWDWRNNERWLAPHGGSGGSQSTLWCDFPAVATGLWVYSWYGDFGAVYGIKLICEEIREY